MTHRQLCVKKINGHFLQRVALDWGPYDKTHLDFLNSVYPIHTCTQSCHPATGLSAGVAVSWHTGWFLFSEQQKQQQLNWNLPGTQFCGLLLHSFAINFLPITFNVLLWKLRNKEVSYHDKVNTCKLHGLQCSVVQWTKCLLQIKLQQCIWIQA